MKFICRKQKSARCSVSKASACNNPNITKPVKSKLSRIRRSRSKRNARWKCKCQSKTIANRKRKTQSKSGFIRKSKTQSKSGFTRKSKTQSKYHSHNMKMTNRSSKNKQKDASILKQPQT